MHLAGDEREPIPGPGRDLAAPEGHTAVSVGAGLTAPGSPAALFRGLSRPYVQGLLPLPGTSRGGASQPSPARVCRAPQPLLAAASFHVLVILWVPPQPQDFLCPPSTPILLRVELRVPTRERRLGRGEGGAVSESPAPTHVTCPLRSSRFSLQGAPRQDAPGFLQEGIKRGEGFPIEHGNY